MIIECTCFICGSKFEEYSNRIRDGRGKFCTRKCYDIWQRTYKQEIYFYLCEDCGKAVHIRHDHLSDRNNQYCNSCNIKHYQVIKYGKDHPNWHGGSSFEGYPIEFNRKLKREIRERDNYKCQECGYTEKQLGYKLSIHHIDFNKMNNQLSNLISLCKSCHAQTNFNREDWEIYFRNRMN
jgi:predicted nucleic acid-binding Zn ribbon protein